MACNASGALTGGPSRLLIAPQSVDTIASWIHPEKRKRRRRITLQLFGSVRCPEPVLVIAQRFRSKLPPPQQPQLSSSYRCPAETRLFFECSFHMFVPSLSWSSNHFGRKRRVFCAPGPQLAVQQGAIRAGRMAVLLRTQTAKRFVQTHPPFLFKLSLCFLS